MPMDFDRCKGLVADLEGHAKPLSRSCGVFGAAILLLAGCATTQRERPYLDVALRPARWIQSAERATEAGKTWPPDPEKPEVIDTSLYSGSAGVVLFFLEAYASTGAEQFLMDARAGADDLLNRIPEKLGNEDAGLYTGIAGIGFALLETYKATGNEAYRRGVRRCVDLLQTHARKVGNGIEWDGVADIISGGAGTGLFLLYVARELDVPQARESKGAPRACCDKVASQVALQSGGIEREKHRKT